MSKPLQKNINGIFLLDKPLNLTSNQALQRVKRLFSAKKAGHTGSLDPLATGMLPICFGEATKFSQFLLESDKTYQVTATLGIKTTTGDKEGAVVATRHVGEITSQQILTVLEKFKGDIQQIPPMYSALKIDGRPLYELARKGIEIERQARTITIYHLTLVDMTLDSLKLDIHCSKGTYVRTLIEDIGEMLGCGAHVSELRRGAVVPYESSTMYTLETLEKLLAESGHEALEACMLPLETSVQAFPKVTLSTSAVFYIKMGQPVMSPNLPKQGLVRIYANDNLFLGVGEITEDGRLAPRRLIQTLN